jgi:hypothetical protein
MKINPEARRTFDRSVILSGTPVSSTNETDCHDITEILLIVALNTITLTQKPITHLFDVNNLAIMDNFIGLGSLSGRVVKVIEF